MVCVPDKVFQYNAINKVSYRKQKTYCASLFVYNNLARDGYIYIYMQTWQCDETETCLTDTTKLLITNHK